MPQVIVNKQKWKEAIEGLEVFRELAEQVLRRFSYTASQLRPFSSELTPYNVFRQS